MSWQSTSTVNAANVGLFGQVTAYGTARVTTEPSVLFQDKFDGGTVDTTNRWTATGTTTPTQAAGVMSCSLAASNSLTSDLQSKAVFTPNQGFKQFAGVFLFDSGANLGATNVHRFFGAGQVTSFSYATPVTDGLGFEMDGLGNFSAVCYVAGTRYVINSTNPRLISSAASLAAVGGGASTFGKTMSYPVGWQRLLVVTRGDVTYFLANDFEVPLGVLSFVQPQVGSLPIRMAAASNSSGTVTATGFQCSSISVGDTSGQNQSISDGTYPWRFLQVTSDGSASVNIGGALTSTVAAAGSANVKSSPGRLGRVVVTTAGTASTTFYDNAAGGSTGTIIGITPAVTSVGQVIDFNMPAAVGISAVGGVGSPGLTVGYN